MCFDLIGITETGCVHVWVSLSCRTERWHPGGLPRKGRSDSASPTRGFSEGFLLNPYVTSPSLLSCIASCSLLS